ncbi:7-alpha-hydroxycholest-4-en-3-one 12-alpha-hydroxylase [Colletotrichum trifolii]|uniref:7-alpha-hydroxycholest-4-en-3-one 12-alpha-hydroxylase n=1 Tax=Colletotrichum trifolii TaxID=5466 RepID=A0A4V3HT10_COLTR|nr:7-alpha-hydroxycholest-4-en-3-one 12-alpha-hydroxylase [Colletotrichum trifolii]
MIQHAQGLLGVDEKTMAAVRSGLLGDLLRATKPAFAGEQLERHNLTALNRYAEAINSTQPGQPLELSSLYLWLQTVVTVASAETLYGDMNPLKTGSTLVNDVWTLEGGVQQLTFSVLPSITARAPYVARERLVEALSPLFDPAAVDSLPDVSRCRAEVIRAHGITSPQDIARCELALLHVATVNTAPILFWLIVNIFSQQDLLKALRSECLPLMARGPSSSREEEVTITIGFLQRSCPLLKACFQECLRIYGQPLHSRRALSDTVLTDTRGEQYLFKKGVDVMMPSGVSHTMPDVWGSNAGDFDASRFMNWPDNASREQRAAYMPFGGGKHLCPGRNFATAEILGFVAALILGTDIEAPEGTGNELTVPQSSSAVLGQAISKPRGYANREGLGARIRKRVGFERVKWRFSS